MMVRVKQILLGLILVLNVFQSLVSCNEEALNLANNQTEVETETSIENDNVEPTTSPASRARSIEEFFVDVFANTVKSNLKQKESPVDAFFKGIIPKPAIRPTTTTTSTTTTTTTTASPVEDLAKTLVSIPVKVMPHPKALDVPAKAINKAITKTMNGAEYIEQSLFGGANSDQAKVLDSMTGLGLTAKVEPEPVFKDEMQIDGAEYVRQPKYISKHCNFRTACEIGKLLRPATPSTIKPFLESSKFLQDLQNKYTRATTYGIVRGNCTRYYCVFVQLLGGPKEFARAVSDLINRTVNPELYE